MSEPSHLNIRELLSQSLANFNCDDESVRVIFSAVEHLVHVIAAPVTRVTTLQLASGEILTLRIRDGSDTVEISSSEHSMPKEVNYLGQLVDATLNYNERKVAHDLIWVRSHEGDDSFASQEEVKKAWSEYQNEPDADKREERIRALFRSWGVLPTADDHLGNWYLRTPRSSRRDMQLKEITKPLRNRAAESA